jgi:hypothetical protein
MPINPEDITAAPEGAVKPAKEPAADKGSDGGLPDELLEAVPALGLLMEGAPPATYAASDAEYPELKVVEKHVKDLGKAGFGIYQTKDKANVVLFNGLLVTPDEIKAADEAGQLDSVATPYDQLRNEFKAAAGDSGGPAPASGAESEVSAAPAAPAAPAGDSSTTPSQITTARVANLDVGAPTSGPVPGQGRILNSILKPVV